MLKIFKKFSSIFIKNSLCTSGPMQFKPMLFKGQLYFERGVWGEIETTFTYFFFTVYCYNCSVLLLIIVNLLLCLIYRLNFIIGMCI